MTETTHDYNQRAKRAIGQLMGRQVLLQVLTFGGGIVLARTLGPGPFGLYVISTFVVGLFALLGDFGLAPSLIQRKGELLPLEIQVGFTVQQALITAMVIALWVAAPWLARWLYPDQAAVVWLVRALSFNLYLTSWRTMSAIQLEREVKFDGLARIEVVEVLVYQGLAVGLSLLGMGTWSFVIAAIVQGILGTTLIYAAAPWPVRLRFNWAITRDLIRFGLPFQAQTLLNSAGGWVTPLIVGHFLGPVGVGYLTWASSNGRKPLMVTDNIMRVGFPHIARLQSNSAEVERIVVRYLTFSLLVAGLWFAAVYCCTPAAIYWVYKTKWVPANAALVLYAAVLPFDMASWIIGMSLNGIGRIRPATVAVAARTVGNVLLAMGLIHWWPTAERYDAVPTAYLIASAVTIPWLIAAVRPGALPRITGGLIWIAVPVGVGIAVGLATSAATNRLPSPMHVIATGFVTCVGYAVSAVAAAPPWLRNVFLGYVGKIRPVLSR